MIMAEGPVKQLGCHLQGKLPALFIYYTRRHN